MKKLPIIEMFTSIQGESQNAGIPHVIIRLTGCNLNCSFSNSICDTAYASWAPESGKYTWEDVYKFLDENEHINYAFITGGEPTIYPTLLIELLEVLKQKDFITAIETNGTNYIPELDGLLDLVTISPKLKNSVPVKGMIAKSPWVDRVMTEFDSKRQETTRKQYDQMIFWHDNFKCQFKFVVSTGEEMKEIEEIKNTIGLENKEIYLMPEGDINDKIQDRRQMVAELCVKAGYNYTDRLHILIWGNKRGV